MKTLRAAVVGVGHLGRFHAQKYAALPGVALTAVVDICPDRADEVAEETGAKAYTDYRQLIGQVDMVSVVAPASEHYGITRDLLEAGIHVLVEKPITETVAHGKHLLELAERHKRVLQVGLLERFNPVIQALNERVTTPIFIEAHRLSSFQPRGTDVSVVLDLMIHDIDHALRLVNAPIERIDACGAPVLSQEIDIAHAYIQFTNGSVANLTASRASFKSERRLRVFQQDSYFSADMSHLTLNHVRRHPTDRAPGFATVEGDQLSFDSGDALKEEIEAFVASVRQGEPPLVTGAEGVQALQAAIEVIHRIEANPLLQVGHPGSVRNGEKHG